MARKKFILKPVADISLQHSLYPADSTTGYNLINEEVDDGDATYIYKSVLATREEETVTSTFKMGCDNVPDNYYPIACWLHTNIKSTMGSDDEKSSVTLSLQLGENSEDLFTIELTNGLMGGTYDYEYRPIRIYNLEKKIQNFYEESQNNSDPQIILSITTHIEASSAEKATDHEVKIGQVYLEVEYTDYMQSSIKCSTEWAKPVTTYKKINGTWSELTETEFLEDMQNNSYSKDNESIAMYPMLKSGVSWRNGRDSTYVVFDEINIVDSYTPNGSEIDSWAADVDESGDIMCYVTSSTISNEDGTTETAYILTIAGNGSGGIYMHPNSKYFLYNFYHDAEEQGDTLIYGMTMMLHGIDLLKTYTLTNLDYAFHTAFYDMNVSTSIDISDWDVEELKGTFTMCTGNENGYMSIILPKNLKKISHYCFNLSQLGNLLIPSTLEEIYVDKKCPFYSSIKSITIEEDNPYFYMENGCLIKESDKCLYAIDESFTTIPNNITVIHHHSMQNSFCSFDSLVIPASVVKIGSHAIYSGSERITNFTFLSTTPPEVDENFICIHDTLVITVPAGCGEAYKTATGWTDCADYIVEAS